MTRYRRSLRPLWSTLRPETLRLAAILRRLYRTTTKPREKPC